LKGSQALTVTTRYGDEGSTTKSQCWSNGPWQQGVLAHLRNSLLGKPSFQTFDYARAATSREKPVPALISQMSATKVLQTKLA